MFKRSGYPVLIGASRKRFVSAALNDAGIGEPTMDDRDNATAALSALCAEHGAWAVRVHDVRRSRAALTIGSLWRQYPKLTLLLSRRAVGEADWGGHPPPT